MKINCCIEVNGGMYNTDEEVVQTLDREAFGSLKIVCSCQLNEKSMYFKVFVVETKREFTFDMKNQDENVTYDIFTFDNIESSFNIPQDLNKITLVFRVCTCKNECFSFCSETKSKMIMNGMLPCDKIEIIRSVDDDDECIFCFKCFRKQEIVEKFPCGHLGHVKCLEKMFQIRKCKKRLMCNKCFKSMIIEPNYLAEIFKKPY